ncbi:MAG: GNAT family N-acetyltransferase [Desulfobacter sp.]|nr:MAG: GNAT family N-acetyltransferase [Desulfobacter sp.]
MNNVDIISFSEFGVDDAKRYLMEMKEIFFATSIRKEFQPPLQKEKYYKTWLGFYLDSHPELTLLAILDRRCVGYITGLPDSASEKYLFKMNSAYGVFRNLYNQYPAHLHINCRPNFQGKGIGTILIKSFIDTLLQMNITGVHIVTAHNGRNIAFYKKLDFSFQTTRTFQNRELLFMARSL